MIPHPASVDDLARCDTIIDVRSPAEYALDHIPGALNCPVLDDAERARVGTLYAQFSAFEARRVGAAIVSRRIAEHLETHLADRPKGWRPLLYCWRGGMRSASFATVLRMIGWDARTLQGGYKAWRAHVIERIATLAPTLPLTVICGATGSAKTRVLHALAAAGEQVLDLEGLAAHRGSVLGALPGVEQPSQKGFETGLVHALDRLDPARRIWVEAESRRIGRLTLPEPLLLRLRASSMVEIAAARPARIAHLLRDYAALADDPEALATRLAALHGLVSNEMLARWQGWARARELEALVAGLLAEHYDPLYARSQGQHFARLHEAQRVETDDLGAAGVAALARRLLERP